MGKQPRHLIDEADIGSGEKSPAEQETDRMIDQLGQPAEKKPEGRDQQRHSGKEQKKDHGSATRKEH